MCFALIGVGVNEVCRLEPSFRRPGYLLSRRSVALRPRLATGLPFSRTVIPLPGMAYNTDMRRGRAINTSGSNHDATWPYY
jgi:hypothetical protein